MNNRRETATIWFDPALGNLELLRATYITHSFARHTHDGFALGVIEDGVQAVDFGRAQRVLIPAGSIALINPGDAHTGYAADAQGWTYRMCYPDAKLLQQVASDLGDRDRGLPCFRSPVIHDPVLAQQIQTLLIFLETPNAPVIERETHLLATLTQLIRRHADRRPLPRRPSPEQRTVQILQDYIEVHYQRDISLQELAHLVNLSRFHLCRVFQAGVGLPPHAYLTLVRVEKAKQLLRLGRPIAQVAQDVGFFDQTHLAKRFKRIVGVTPRQYLAHTAITY